MREKTLTLASVLAVAWCAAAGCSGGSGNHATSNGGHAGTDAGGGNGGATDSGTGGTGGSGVVGTGGTGGSGAGGTGGSGIADSGGGGTGGSGGSAGSGGCPATSPPGPAALRFDVATLNCNPTGSCTGSETKCLCQADFDHLDVAPAHFMTVSSDRHKAKVWAAGNLQAAYVNDITTGWTQGASAQAHAILDAAKAGFPCGVPRWFILNEISPSLWPRNANYRAYIVQLADLLKNTYNKRLVFAAPFPKPAHHSSDWKALRRAAFVGVERYLTGSEINQSGNSVSYCQSKYQASVNAYASVNVPLSRLFLFEHFGNTTAGTVYGRAGVSAAGWTNAIKARSRAAHNVGFAGFVSYGWGGNQMHAPESDRLGFMDTYEQQTLP